jgi:Zn-finger nucleic acid-binding protein
MTGADIKRSVCNCPNCGAAATPTSVRCAYCHSGLASLICSKCFGAIFTGMKHCPWCGENAAAGKLANGINGKCPRCNTAFLLVTANNVVLNECPACGGLWVDNDTLQTICANQEQQQAIMGFNPELTLAKSTPAVQSGRMYIPCPECENLMNRRQFAGCSGVIVDWCKAHGVWFDRNELRQIVQFIQAGGLHKAQEREKLKLEEERESLREKRWNLERLGRIEGNYDLAAPQDNCNLELLDLLGRIGRALKIIN